MYLQHVHMYQVYFILCLVLTRPTLSYTLCIYTILKSHFPLSAFSFCSSPWNNACVQIKVRDTWEQMIGLCYSFDNWRSSYRYQNYLLSEVTAKMNLLDVGAWKSKSLPCHKWANKRGLHRKGASTNRLKRSECAVSFKATCHILVFHICTSAGL